MPLRKVAWLNSNSKQLMNKNLIRSKGIGYKKISVQRNNGK